MEDEDRSEFNRAKELGITDRIRFLGWVENARAALAAADLFLMPSLYEGFSIAALEALALGLPAVLADTPGLSDLRAFFPQVRYWNLEAATLPGLIDSALDAAASFPATVATDQAARCREMFSPGRGAGEYARLYWSMLKERQA